MIAQAADHAAGDKVRLGLVDAAARHAVVRRPDQNANPARLQHLFDDIGDLCREPLLELQAPGINLNYSRELADADHTAIGNVSHPCAADNGRQVVLATAPERTPRSTTMSS